MIHPRHFYLLSLGCSKNTVDSASIGQLLIQVGYQQTDSPRHAEVLLVNTCGFIGSARAESIAALQELGRKKRRGQYLLAVGCLVPRGGADLIRQIPQLDGLLSTRQWAEIVPFLDKVKNRQQAEPIYNLSDSVVSMSDAPSVARVARQGGSAYVKIADGCRRPCAFCSIPLIKGTAVSRPPERIVAEVVQLQQQGVQEVILIAQDTTDYGSDFGWKDGLTKLLYQISEAAPALTWLRILYAYPGYVTDSLMEAMATIPNIVPYLDMPLQHASHATLLRMRRPANMGWVRETVAKLREKIPNVALRSTFIVGYPGETESEFEELLQFLQEIQLDRVGVFPFSFEPGTTSATLGDTIPMDVKEERRNRVLELQQAISLAKNQQWVGKTMPILVEGTGDGVSIGRSYRDAPEVDGMVVVDGVLPLGKIAMVRVTGALAYDWMAVPVK